MKNINGIGVGIMVLFIVSMIIFTIWVDLGMTDNTVAFLVGLTFASAYWVTVMSMCGEEGS